MPAYISFPVSYTHLDILVIGQGNFGTPDGDPPAAARYTEAKLSGMGVEIGRAHV